MGGGLSTRGVVTGPDGTAQDEWRGKGAWDQAGERRRARQEEGEKRPEAEGAGGQNPTGESTSSAAPSTLVLPPVTPLQKGPLGTEPRDQEEVPSTALIPAATKTGQAKPRNVFHPSLRSTSLILAHSSPGIPPAAPSYLPLPSLPEPPRVPSMEASGPRVVINRFF